MSKNNSKKNFPPLDTGPHKKEHDHDEEPIHEHNIHNKVQTKGKVSST